LTACGTLLALVSLLACGSAYQGTPVPAPAKAAGPATPASPALSVMMATCKGYDYDSGTMEVITGVSFALREVTFKIHEDTEITIDGTRADPTDMQAGMVVRVEYRATAQGNLAERIEVVLDATGMRGP
jgi:hypothetical protein